MEFKTAKTIRFRQIYKPDQEAKFIVEVQEDEGRSWMKLASFTERSRAEGFVQGYKGGLKHFTSADAQIAVPTLQDEWPKE